MEPKREGWSPVFFLLRVFASDSRQRAVSGFERRRRVETEKLGRPSRCLQS